MDRFGGGLKTAARFAALEAVGDLREGRRDVAADRDENAEGSDRYKERDHRVFDRGRAA